MILITNNPLFLDNKDYYEKNGLKIFFENVSDYLNVLYKVRDYVHKGYKILTHPLYGSVKPNETIYRSVVLEEGNYLDYSSLKLIEESIECFMKFQNNKVTPNWTDRIKKDFQVIDFDLMSKAINRIIK